MPILVAAPADGPPPFAVDAQVREECRWLVLSAPPIVRETREHPIRLHTAVLQAEPAQLGSVVVRGRDPVELLAVVHDLDREPSVLIGDVVRALDAVMGTCAARGLTRIALPLLGTRHGRIARDAVIEATARALASAAHVTAVWLVTEDAADVEAIRGHWPKV